MQDANKMCVHDGHAMVHGSWHVLSNGMGYSKSLLQKHTSRTPSYTVGLVRCRAYYVVVGNCPGCVEHKCVDLGSLQ